MAPSMAPRGSVDERDHPSGRQAPGPARAGGATGSPRRTSRRSTDVTTSNSPSGGKRDRVAVEPADVSAAGTLRRGGEHLRLESTPVRARPPGGPCAALPVPQPTSSTRCPGRRRRRHHLLGGGLEVDGDRRVLARGPVGHRASHGAPEPRGLNTNCTVRTLDPAAPLADSIAIDGNLVRPRRAGRPLDHARRSCVVPGFADAHVHFPTWSLGLGQARLEGSAVARRGARAGARRRSPRSPPAAGGGARLARRRLARAPPAGARSAWCRTSPWRWSVEGLPLALAQLGARAGRRPTRDRRRRGRARRRRRAARRAARALPGASATAACAWRCRRDARGHCAPGLPVASSRGVTAGTARQGRLARGLRGLRAAG